MKTDVSSAHRDASPSPATDLRGASRLVVDAIVGTTDIVENMHRNISGLAPIVGFSHKGRTTGISGWVYRCIRGLSRMVGAQLDAALALLAPLSTGTAPSPKRQAVIAALNGVLGDHLVASDNPLATPMRIRTNGHPLTLDRHALADAIPTPSSKLLVLVHGLCMSDRGWSRNEHDHGTSLALALGYTPLYLHYNSGRPISTNGRHFAVLMEQLVQEWPVPVREVALMGHSMGGLVSRSACHYARLGNHDWPRRLAALAFLGTPHHGAPLERAGNWVDLLASMSPYTAPLARIGHIRSAGVKDLRYGTLIDADGEHSETGSARVPNTSVPLPRAPQCFAVAATTQPHENGEMPHLPWDGLVPVASALGRHANPTRSLAIPETHQRIFHGLTHLDLLSSREVFDQLHHWLSDV